MVMVQSPWDCCKITALYPCNFLGTAQELWGNLAIAAQGPYDYLKSLQSSYNFPPPPNGHLKSYVVDMISVRPLCCAGAMLCVYGLPIF